MAIPLVCQVILFYCELELTKSAERLATAERNELIIDQHLMDIIQLSNLNWADFLNKGMLGAVVSPSFDENLSALRKHVADIRAMGAVNERIGNLLTQTEDLAVYLERAKSQLARNKAPASQTANEALIGLVNRLKGMRTTAELGGIKIDALMQTLREDRAALQSTHEALEKQRQQVQQFLFYGLVFDILLGIAVPIFFLKGISKRVHKLISNARSLATGETLDRNISGDDEISFLNDTLCDATERLRASEQSKQMMMDMIAHDIRSPLTSAEFIISEISVPESNLFVAAPDQKLRRLQTIFSQVKRLVEDVLSLERLQSGEFELALDFFDISELIKNSVASATPQADAKRVRIEDDLRFCEVVADSARINQVLDNLFSNAIKHSPVGGTISVTNRVENGALLVAITDQGPGLSRKDEQRAFEKGFQTAEGKARGGYGLGLTISELLIQKHDGKIRLKNNPDGGCVAVFTLPLDI
ncbi:MAG TPA: HAMP domain-containing sensor histidine kinase [Drouetiella sp.]